MVKQIWNAAKYALKTPFVAELGLPVVDLLAPRRGERVLDLGCGDGALTERLVMLGCDVVGVDASEDMVAATRARGLRAEVMDGERLAFSREFDAVFSNAALHWMKDADAVLDGVARALRPGGRFVAEFGGHGNVAAVTVALMAVLERRGYVGAAASPWYFPSPAAYRAKLESHGFRVKTIQLIPRPTILPGDMRDWLDVFGGAFLNLLPSTERDAALDEAVELLRPVLCDEAGRWTADYVRLRLSAALAS